MEKNERNNSKYNKLKAGSLRRQTKPKISRRKEITKI